VTDIFRQLWADLGVNPWPALALVISTTVLFWFFTGVTYWLGPRLRLRVSPASLALMTVIGAITARAILGQTPTLVGGLIALTILFFWEWVLRHSSRWFTRGRRRHREAWVVMADGVANPAILDKLAITEVNLWVRLRRAGVTRLADVHLAIIEADGSLTVVRAGQVLDEELMTGVSAE
jgi:uncharacterized membrane protein YcaP (DUF421 family)